MPLTLYAQEYVPLTKAEVDEWLQTQTLDEVFDFIIIADDWEHSDPKLILPDVYAILDKDGTLYITYKEPIKVTIGTVAPLSYRIHLEEMVIKDFYVESKKPLWPWFAVGGGGILSGIIIGLLLN